MTDNTCPGCGSTCTCNGRNDNNGQDVGQEKESKLREVIEKHKETRGALIPVLHEAQEIYGYLPMKVQKIISEGLDIPLTEIYGTVTFYSQFSLTPKGEHRIQVCMGTACYVKGSGLILDKLKEKLGINVGECTPDKLFSLDACRCIGACGLAPVMMIDDEVYGKLTPEAIEGIIDKYVKQALQALIITEA